MSDELTYAEVYYSTEYQQYALIPDEEAAYHYAREEILAARERETAAKTAAPLPYKTWYLQYLQTPEWRQRADAVKERFGGRCALCNSDKNLEAHHRTYERVGTELPDDLTALCADCHGTYHRWRGALPQ